MVDPFETEKRPRLPELVEEAVREKAGVDENTPFWKSLLKADPELQDEVREKEKRLEEELGGSIFNDEGLERSIDDIL